MTDETLELEENIRKYLSMCWYDYGCADKEKVNQIIRREIKNNPEMGYDKLKVHIKRKCQAET